MSKRDHKLPRYGDIDIPEGAAWDIARAALFSLRIRYHLASFTRAGVTPLVRARAIVAHDRILTGDPRHVQA